MPRLSAAVATAIVMLLALVAHPGTPSFAQVVATATIFANPASTHLSVVPIEFPYTFEIGPHDFTLNPLNNATTSDKNDFYCVTVQY